MESFGRTVTQTIAAFRRARLGSADRAGSHAAVPELDQLARSTAIARIVISFSLLLLGGYFVVGGQENAARLGSSLLGAVAGYWLR